MTTATDTRPVSMKRVDTKTYNLAVLIEGTPATFTAALVTPDTEGFESFEGLKTNYYWELELLTVDNVMVSGYPVKLAKLRDAKALITAAVNGGRVAIPESAVKRAAAAKAEVEAAEAEVDEPDEPVAAE